MSVRIYGASDDLVEIVGASCHDDGNGVVGEHASVAAFEEGHRRGVEAMTAPATQPAQERLTDVELVAAALMASRGWSYDDAGTVAQALAYAGNVVETLRARRGR